MSSGKPESVFSGSPQPVMAAIPSSESASTVKKDNPAPASPSGAGGNDFLAEIRAKGGMAALKKDNPAPAGEQVLRAERPGDHRVRRPLETGRVLPSKDAEAGGDRDHAPQRDLEPVLPGHTVRCLAPSPRHNRGGVHGDRQDQSQRIPDRTRGEMTWTSLRR